MSKKKVLSEGMYSAWSIQNYMRLIKAELRRNNAKYVSFTKRSDVIDALYSFGNSMCDCDDDFDYFSEAIENLEYQNPGFFEPANIALMDSEQITESITNLAKRNPEKEEEIFYGEEALDLLLQDKNDVSYYYYAPDRDPNENRWHDRRETELSQMSYKGKTRLQIGIPEKYCMFLQEIPVEKLKVVCHTYDDYCTVYDGDEPIANLVIFSAKIPRPQKFEGDYPRRRDDDFGYWDYDEL